MFVNLHLSTQLDCSLALSAFSRYQDELIDRFNRQEDLDAKDDLRLAVSTLGDLMFDLAQRLIEHINETEAQTRSSSDQAVIEQLRDRLKQDRMKKYSQ